MRQSSSPSTLMFLSWRSNVLLGRCRCGPALRFPLERLPCPEVYVQWTPLELSIPAVHGSCRYLKPAGNAFMPFPFLWASTTRSWRPESSHRPCHKTDWLALTSQNRVTRRRKSCLKRKVWRTLWQQFCTTVIWKVNRFFCVSLLPCYQQVH